MLPALPLLMTTPNVKPEKGAAGYILAWVLGIPIPILLIVFLVSRC
jgi:hypothetical protein